MSETSDIAEIANNPRLTPNQKALFIEELQAGMSMLDIMQDVTIEDAKEIKTLRTQATTSAADMSRRAGWYAEPEGEKSYWDGRQWTHRWVAGVGSVPWKDNETSSGPGAEQPSASAMAQRNEASVVNDMADIANSPRLSPNKKLLIIEQLKAGRALVDIMDEIAAEEIKSLQDQATTSASAEAKSTKANNQMRWAFVIIGVLALLSVIVNSNLGR
jgi:hypothetical protein